MDIFNGMNGNRGFNGSQFSGFGRGFNNQNAFLNRGNLWNEIKQSFHKGSDLVKLIYINIGVYLCLKLLFIIGFLIGQPYLPDIIVKYLAVPSSLQDLAIRPWTVFTYMFVHEGFLHLLFNMLWLYWLGRMFINSFPKVRLRYIYILGGLAGALLYILAYNIFPAFSDVMNSSVAVGASASVMAIIFAVSFYRPNYTIFIPFIGDVKMIYIALIFIGIDLLSLTGGNAGGHIAHLGGALFGYLFAISKRGKIGKKSWENKSRMKVKYKTKSNKTNKAKDKDSDRINEILEKVSKSGYESLSSEEKKLLFKSGQK